MSLIDCEFDEARHLYRAKGNGLLAPSTTQVIECVGLMKPFFNERAAERKSKIGDYAHLLTVMHDRGEKLEEYDIDPRVRPYVDSYLEFSAKARYKVILAEHGPFISDAINGMLCGFKLDRVCMLDGQEAVGEIKCTADDEPHHGFQLAGYDLCMGGPRRKRFVMRLQPDGKVAKLKDYDDPQDYQIFTSALAVTWAKMNLKLWSPEDRGGG